MKSHKRLLIACAVLLPIAVPASGAEGRPLVEREAELAAMGVPHYLDVPRLEMPLYVMEYHIWYMSPFGEGPSDGFMHWDIDNARADRQMGPDWMRDKFPAGYPLPGLYNSEDRGIIRWQVQTMRNAGIDGAFVQMFPEWVEGDRYPRQFIWEQVLDIAAEEGFSVGAHDELQFQPGRPSQEPEIMAARMGGFIKAFGDHPGYLRIDGKPAMKFQFWDRFQGTMSPEVLRQTLLNAEEAAGREIYWIVQAGAAEDLYSLGEIDAFVTMSNMLLPEAGVDGFLEDPDLNWDEVAHHARILPEQRERFPHLDLGWWVYPGFDETPRVARWDQERFRWLPRRGGRTLVETLQRYAEASPDFILLTSWNDWEENTAIEPGLMYDGYEGDPYLYCRIIAAAKGKTFEPAPLPPEDSVDPWMLQPLYGVDRTPPVVQHIRYLPLQPGVVATVTDSGGPVPSAVAVARGDAYIDARSPDTRELAGILHMEPEWPEAGDLVLRAGQPLTITLDPEALDADSERDVFLGLEYADEAEGAVRITYPTEHETLDWRLTENKVYRVQTSIALENDGDLQAAVRRLRGFQVTEEPLTLRLELDGDGEIPITRLHVFHGLQHRAEGRPIDGLGPESQVRTFLFDTPNLMGDAPKAAYIVATDHAGNESMPVPIHGANQHPLANRP